MDRSSAPLAAASHECRSATTEGSSTYLPLEGRLHVGRVLGVGVIRRPPRASASQSASGHESMVVAPLRRTSGAAASPKCSTPSVTPFASTVAITHHPRTSPGAAGESVIRPPSRARRSSAGAGRRRARSRAPWIDPQLIRRLGAGLGGQGLLRSSPSSPASVGCGGNGLWLRTASVSRRTALPSRRRTRCGPPRDRPAMAAARCRARCRARRSRPG
jgi:hypothetical protein